MRKNKNDNIDKNNIDKNNEVIIVNEKNNNNINNNINNNNIDKDKMTIDEYIDKYSRRENRKWIRTMLFVLIGLIGVLVGALLTLIVLRLFDINKIVGYIGACVSVIIFILIYLIPVIKITRARKFETNIGYVNARSAKKHNKKVRHDIASSIIEFSSSVDGIGWYNNNLAGKLAIALHNNNEDELRSTLSELYKKDIKATANSIIR